MPRQSVRVRREVRAGLTGAQRRTANGPPQSRTVNRDAVTRILAYLVTNGIAPLQTAAADSRFGSTLAACGLDAG